MRIGNPGFKDSNINKTLGHTMNLNDLLEVELYNDNLKMFSQAWEEKSSALGNDLDEHVPENLYERQAKGSTLMTHAIKTLFLNRSRKTTKY